MGSSRTLTVSAAMLMFSIAARAAQPLGPVAGMPSVMATGAHNSGQGYLGVATRTVGDPVLGTLHLKEAHGACVVMVDHDSPAWKSGIREHDVVVNLNGTTIDSEEQLARLLRDMQPGRGVQVVISRDGSQQTFNAVLADRDEIGKLAWEQHFVVPAPTDIPDDTSIAAAPSRSHSSTVFGHSFVGGHLLPGGLAYTGAMVDEIGPQLAEYFGLKSGKGLLVHSVDANSPAATAGLHAGDVICKVNGQSMATRSDWAHALRDSKGHPVSVNVMREHREQTLTIVPDSKRHSEVESPELPGADRHWLAVFLVRPRGF